MQSAYIQRTASVHAINTGASKGVKIEISNNKAFHLTLPSPGHALDAEISLICKPRAQNEGSNYLGKVS